MSILVLIERIGTDQSLIEKVFVIAVWRFGAPELGLFRPVGSAPCSQILFPFGGQFRECVDARARILGRRDGALAVPRPGCCGAAPPLIIYAFLMDYYIAGLTAGATKG